MKRKILALSIVLCLLLAACGNTEPDQGASDDLQENSAGKQDENNSSDAGTPDEPDEDEATKFDNLSQLIPELLDGGEICVPNPWRSTERVPIEDEPQAAIRDLLLQVDLSSFAVVSPSDLIDARGWTESFIIQDGDIGKELIIHQTDSFQYFNIRTPTDERLGDSVVYENLYLKGDYGAFPMQELNDASSAALAAAQEAGILVPPVPVPSDGGTQDSGTGTAN